MEQIIRIFKEIGAQNGFEIVIPIVKDFATIKVRYTLGGVSFRPHVICEVSDYLIGAPECAVRFSAERIFDVICNRTPRDMSDDVIDALFSDSFARRNQHRFIERHNGTVAHRFHSLSDAYDRLTEFDIVWEDVPEGWEFRWSDSIIGGRPYMISGMTKVILIDTALDREDVPEEVIDFLLGTGALGVELGADRNLAQADEVVAKIMARYPGSDVAIDWLNEHGYAH